MQAPVAESVLAASQALRAPDGHAALSALLERATAPVLRDREAAQRERESSMRLAPGDAVALFGSGAVAQVVAVDDGAAGVRIVRLPRPLLEPSLPPSVRASRWLDNEVLLPTIGADAADPSEMVPRSAIRGPVQLLRLPAVLVGSAPPAATDLFLARFALIGASGRLAPIDALVVPDGVKPEAALFGLPPLWSPPAASAPVAQPQPQRAALLPAARPRPPLSSAAATAARNAAQLKRPAAKRQPIARRRARASGDDAEADHDEDDGEDDEEHESDDEDEDDDEGKQDSDDDDEAAAAAAARRGKRRTSGARSGVQARPGKPAAALL